MGVEPRRTGPGSLDPDVVELVGDELCDLGIAVDAGYDPEIGRARALRLR
jgi:hypothetical protein